VLGEQTSYTFSVAAAVKTRDQVSFRRSVVDWNMLPAESLFKQAIERFPEWIMVSSSFGAESAVLLALVADVDPAVPVLVLVTGMHFDETLDHAMELKQRLSLTDFRLIRLDGAVLDVEDPERALWMSYPDYSCQIRKVRPFDAKLENFDSWMSETKCVHGDHRQSASRIESQGGGSISIRLQTGIGRDCVSACVGANFRHNRWPGPNSGRSVVAALPQKSTRRVPRGRDTARKRVNPRVVSIRGCTL
jgi:hypothetical protein